VKNRKPRKRVNFGKTRRAIRKIKSAALRRDFGEMLYGLEFSHAHGSKRIALKCAQALVGMAIGLHRTITPTVATEILLGISRDRKQDALFRPLNVVDDHKDQKCVRQQCITSKGSTCITIRGAGGCGNRFGFQLPWRSASIA
jgi:hypothetical protein